MSLDREYQDLWMAALAGDRATVIRLLSTASPQAREYVRQAAVELEASSRAVLVGSETELPAVTSRAAVSSSHWRIGRRSQRGARAGVSSHRLPLLAASTFDLRRRLSPQAAGRFPAVRPDAEPAH